MLVTISKLYWWNIVASIKSIFQIPTLTRRLCIAYLTAKISTATFCSRYGQMRVRVTNWNFKHVCNKSLPKAAHSITSSNSTPTKINVSNSCAGHIYLIYLVLFVFKKLISSSANCMYSLSKMVIFFKSHECTLSLNHTKESCYHEFYVLCFSKVLHRMIKREGAPRPY